MLPAAEAGRGCSPVRGARSGSEVRETGMKTSSSGLKRHNARYAKNTQNGLFCNFQNSTVALRMLFSVS